ncbi:hypothetical protein [Spirillospora sp. NPDC029432]|uniref:hypothetical protein n=1 Tax=Spirillospora sp. NPDC029432 TaxID=3154599 RepID=UPI0034519DCD
MEAQETVPEPPRGTPGMAAGDDPAEVSGFVAAQAARHGVIGNRAALLVIAAGEVSARLREPADVRVWRAEDGLYCAFRTASGRPAEPRPTPGVELVTAGPVTVLRLPL